MLLSILPLFLIACVRGWYLPGSAPTEYQKGSDVQVKANSLRSIKTQLPLRYYDLPLCVPHKIQSSKESLGEILMGDRIETSPYTMKVLMEARCSFLCSKELSKADKSQFSTAIDDAYVAHLMVDNLPVAMRLLAGDNPVKEFLVPGYPIGYVNPEKQHLVYNHLVFTLRYHVHQGFSGESTLRVVGFEVEPKSIKHTKDSEGKYVCNDLAEPLVLEDDSISITFTYDVEWVESPLRWTTRWDIYLANSKGETDIHWFSILNSLLIVLFLSAVIGMILLRTVLRDITAYNAIDEEAQEEIGWKNVHGEVFRRPQFSRLLAVCAGTGIQIAAMTTATIIFAVLGFLTPANRGGLLQAMLIIFALMGVPAGYMAARLNKLTQKETTSKSLSVTFMTAFLFPGVCFSIFFILNIVIWNQGSSGAVPFKTLVVLLLLWFCLSVPSVYIGAFFGYQKQPIALPVRTNQIPREIPPGRWTSHPVFTCLIGGILPFGAVFTELLFIMSSIWQQEYYYLFGFLLLVLVILIITCAEISMAFTYFQLTAEDYKWWWRSFWYSGTSALYVFLFSIIFMTKLELTKAASIVLFLGYMAIMSYAFLLLTGSIGFLSSFLFVRSIYGSIKVD